MNFLDQNGKHIEAKKPQCQSLQHKVTRTRPPYGWISWLKRGVIFVSITESLLAFENSVWWDSGWTGNDLPYLKHQLVKCLHKILLFYKHYIVGTGGEACVPSQIDGELTSETAKAQEVLSLTWKGFSKRYEALFMSKRQQTISVLKIVMRFRVVFLWQKLKV